MKVAVTGHTSGIGKYIYDYFTALGHEVVGFSRSNGYNIADESARNNILDLAKDFDIFVNNAYVNFDDSQERMLRQIADKWKNTNKTIINISSRHTLITDKYGTTKRNLDIACAAYMNSSVRLVNLKPGLIDTPRVTHMTGNKMQLSDLGPILNFVLNSTFKTHSFCFGL